MFAVNQVRIVGYVGNAPEVKHTTSGKKVCTLSVATTEKWKDKDGKPQDKTEWHRVVAWGWLAEYIGDHVGRGAAVAVDGSLSTRKYDKDGVDHYATEIKARDVLLVVKPPKKGAGTPESDQGGAPPREDVPVGDDDGVPF